MSDTLHDQFDAFGVAQVLVVLKNAPPAAAGGHLSAALGAAIPVAASRVVAGAAESLVLKLGKHFTTSETSADSAMAAAAASLGGPIPGAKWYKKAASRKDPTPPARFFPNLGVMLGTVNKQGLAALKKDAQVEAVVAPPTMRLIRPVAAAAVTPARQSTWGIKRLKVDKVHALGYTGKGVIVGHLDTGVDGKHPALKKAIQAFAEFDLMGFEVSPAPKPWDSDDHGTHTAGTIAGRTIGGRAIGVAPDAKLVSALVIEGGNTTARILGGMDWVIGQGARILSMSLGYPGYVSDFLFLTQLLRQRGVLPVFAVGNEGPGTSRSPGNYAEALSVGAMDRQDKVAYFSGSRRFNRTKDPLVPDLVAPGVDVVSAMPGGGYQQMSGTSMATPHIAGLAALLMQINPAASIQQVEQAILGSCTRLPGQSVNRQNLGLPDAVKAMNLI